MRPRLPAVAACAALWLLAFPGCADLLDPLTRPDYHVAATKPVAAPGWNRDPAFRVTADPGVAIVITAESAGLPARRAEGTDDVSLLLPDGTWDISYTVGGHKWASFRGVRIDATPPRITGLQTFGFAPQGNYVIGQGATVTGADRVEVSDGDTGILVATSLPASLIGLADGLHLFQVAATDAAGNFANETVQVRAGNAVALPEGKFTFGVVARYSNDAALWDLARPESYLSRAEAARQVPGLADGYGITPQDDAVQDVVGRVVTPGMNTMQTALALYKWFADNLEYDETRLDSDNLLTPHQVILDTEDPRDTDANHDGLVDDGPGNGVHGGICRDLAATYVSLLRGAGVPARLVSGYVAGEVNGFHAWVEFYAGSVAGQSAWVPVDVSPIDGPYRDTVLMQAFGIRLPEYLPLRPIPAESEKPGWSTAISVGYRWPPSADEPKVSFQKQVASDTTTAGYLCFNPATSARQLARSKSECASFGFYFGGADSPFVIRTQRTIDYGILVESSPRGAEIQAGVAYPFPDDVRPDSVEYKFYGKPFTRNETMGKANAEFST